MLLVKRYGALLATDGVTRLMPGEIHALIDPNGAGKSTLIHLLAGTTKADAGSLWVAGRDVTHASVRQRAGLSRSYQITNIFQGMSVLDNLLLAVQACNGSSFSLWRPRARDSALYDQARLLAADCTIGMLRCFHALRAPCRTANNANSSSPSRWLRAPRCCCLMSRWPAWVPMRRRASPT